MYVIEGATLGIQVISRMLTNVVGNEAAGIWLWWTGIGLGIRKRIRAATQ